MQIKRLVIENFKSIERIELVEPNPFSVFVGPNGSGKSNIFEALEFGNRFNSTGSAESLRLFGGRDALARRTLNADQVFKIKYELDEDPWESNHTLDFEAKEEKKITFLDGIRWETGALYESVRQTQFNSFFSRVALYEKKPRIGYTDDLALTTNASNVEAVLKRVLTNSILTGEIFEWMNLFVPGFKAVEVVSGGFDGKDTLLIYEENSDKPFTKNLISDGTHNILALLTAVYQSDEPQFLCIEEPENGLHPQVQMSLVEFFRKVCAEKGHYIWLNTHSEAIVRKLTTDEIVLVDKQDGTTRTRQVKGMNIYDIPTDEAWLTGTLGGGLPW